MAKRAQREEEPRLQASDWEDAALAAIAEHGLSGLAVEALARKLGVTKGSFYWHFESRDALLQAALERWEQRGTEEIIKTLEGLEGGRARLERLFSDAMTGSGGTLYRALSSSAHPLVAKVMARVAARRIEFVASCYRQLGYPRSARTTRRSWRWRPTSASCSSPSTRPPSSRATPARMSAT